MEADAEISHIVEGESSSKNQTEDATELKESGYYSTYKIRLEFAVLLIFFAKNLSSTVFQNQVLYQTCTAVFGYNTTVCEDLETDKVNTDPQLKSIDSKVQTYASNIFMAGSLVESIIPAILALSLGAWSDKFGRKPVMLLSTSGHLLFFLIKVIISGVALKQNVNPWFYIFASIPNSLCGGSCTLLGAIISYVADLTTFHERPYKICLMNGVMGLGSLIGQLTSSYLYDATNASVVFGVSAIAQIIAIIFIIIFIGESVNSEQLSSEPKFRGLLDWQHFVDMLKTVFKKRPHFERATLWCIVLPLIAVDFDQSGTDNIFFLFVRAQFGWTVQTFTTFNSIRMVIGFVGAVAGIVGFQLVLRFKRTTMVVIAYGCYIVMTSFYAAATASWYLYVGMGITFLSGIASPMGQAMLANTVASSDIGKVFALMTSLEAIVPLIGAPFYTYVYNSTIETYPGAFNCISIGVYTLSFILTGFVHIVEYYYPNINKIKK